MGTKYWVVKFFQSLLIAFAVLTAVHRLKGYSLSQSLWFGLGWGVATAGIYIAARIYHWRRGRACAICEVVPAQKVNHD